MAPAPVATPMGALANPMGALANPMANPMGATLAGGVGMAGALARRRFGERARP